MASQLLIKANHHSQHSFVRIFVISQRVPYPPNKGEKIRTYYQLEYLVSRGYDITLFTIADTATDRQSLADLENKLGITTCSVPIHFKSLRLLAGLFSNKSLSVANFYSKKLQSCLDDILRDSMPDCILCTSSALADYAFNSKSIDNSEPMQPRLVMDFMDLDSAKWHQYAQKSGYPMSLLYRREARLVSAIEQRVCDRFDLVMFVSDSEAELMIDRKKDSAHKIHVVGNGVDVASFRPLTDAVSKPSARLELLFTGVMDYLPNEEAVLWFAEKCWSNVVERYPDARYTIAGMNPSRKVRALEKIQGIEVTGFVDDILPYFHRASIFVASFQMARGLQNKILQSFAAGLPVITSLPGADGIACRDGEHVILAESPEDFVLSIFNLIDDKQLYADLRKNSLALIGNSYSWQSKNAYLASLLENAKESVSPRIC